MSSERWDIIVKVLHGPMAGLGEQVLKGPVVRFGSNPGPGGLKLSGYRGLDGRQCVLTAYDGGSATCAPVGTNQVRMAPHPNVKWKEIDPLRGPEYLSEGCALHLGPVGRGCTVEFVKCRRLGVWSTGKLASEMAGPSDVARGGHVGPPVAIDARSVGTISASSVPIWFIGILFVMAMGTAAIVLILGAWFLLSRQVTALGPVEDGYDFYESIDVDSSEIDVGLLEGLQQPFWVFIMDPNQTAAPARAGLDKPKNWDDRFMKATTVSVEKYVRAWNFFRRLDTIKNEYGKVVRLMRDNDLPEVFAAIPYQESIYKADMQSVVCAKGYWQFMPEVANRIEKKARIPFSVKDCKFRGQSDYLWTPERMAPPPRIRQNAPYLDDQGCKINGCQTDDRMDLTKSTRAAVFALKEAFEDPTLRGSGAVTQMTILSHNAGYNDSRFGREYYKGFNILPAYQKYEKENGKGKGPNFYGAMLRCSTHDSKSWCGSSIPPEAQHYAYAIVAQHFIATCYYAQNYGSDAAFKPWVDFTRGEGYCKNFKIPTKAEVQRRKK